jgi:hypothetical protein
MEGTGMKGTGDMDQTGDMDDMKAGDTDQTSDMD